MRCKSCQLLGHTKTRCTSPATCEGCHLSPHSPADCTRKQCANCGSDHASSDKDCPRFKQTQEILKIKTIAKCSMGEARRKYNETNTPNANSKSTYANVTIKGKSTPINKAPSSPTQTSTSMAKRPATSPPTRTNLPKLQKTQKPLQSNSFNNNTNKTTTKSLNQNINYNQQQNSPHHISQQTKMILDNISTVSPCTKLTQQLLNKNDYFMPIPDSDEEPKL
ncbi:protein air1-like [Rhagoletis pomonella]|uniref:protein air1-like n=1 Tax=Rhagoletis pomonella TaxID=28610 RepID=UPI001781F882|nr:protein air1-like [Rhagoletis pomonella]